MVTPQTPPGEFRSLGQLVSDLSEQTTRLVRAEIDLAKEELAAKAKQAGAGGGLLAGAGAVVFWAIGVLVAAAVLGLAVALPAWAAALIVFVALLAVAALLGYVGVRLLKKSGQTPTSLSMEHLREDVAAVKGGLHG